MFDMSIKVCRNDYYLRYIVFEWYVKTTEYLKMEYSNLEHIDGFGLN